MSESEGAEFRENLRRILAEAAALPSDDPAFAASDQLTISMLRQVLDEIWTQIPETERAKVELPTWLIARANHRLLHPKESP